MSRFLRLPTKDPRTIARDIPGISHILFPQLTSGLVASLNKGIISNSEVDYVDETLMQKSTLRASVLFEFSYIIAEERIKKHPIDHIECFRKAIKRQNKYYDYLPEESGFSDFDVEVASAVANNLVCILQGISAREKAQIIVSPCIHGYEWIANSTGDFSIGDHLIEVKCSNQNFSARDYRQILVYFLLDYIKSLNSAEDTTYKELMLLNPRLNKIVKCNGDDLLFEVNAGRSKVEMVQLFSTIIRERHNGTFL